MNRVWWTVVIVAAIVAVILRHDLLFQTSLLLSLLGGASYLWARYCLVAVTYRRHLGSLRLFYGEETDLTVEIVNAKPLPLSWLRAEDEFPADVELLNGRLSYSHLPRRRILTNFLSLRWYERVTRRYRLRGERRGAWPIGPVDLSSGDLFGFAMRYTRMDEVEYLIVYPRMVPVTALGLPAQHPFGDFATPRRILDDPLRLVGAREYVPGDSFRTIHWKATARRQALQTKVFEPSAARPVAIFLNINTSDYAYEGIDPELQEFAITATASLARRAWEDKLPVGLYVNSVAYPGGKRIRIPPGTRPDQMTWILEALAKVVSLGHWRLAAILQLEVPSLRMGTTIVVVTAVMNDLLRAILADLPRRGYPVVLVTLGSAQLDRPLPGVRSYHLGGRERWRELTAVGLEWQQSAVATEGKPAVAVSPEGSVA